MIETEGLTGADTFCACFHIWEWIEFSLLQDRSGRRSGKPSPKRRRRARECRFT